MELADRLEKQIKCAAAECTAKLAKGELPDPAHLALAVAGGESADSLMKKTKERLDRRAAGNAANEPPQKTSEAVPEVPVKDVVTDVYIEDGNLVVTKDDEPKRKAHHAPTHHTKHK